jgi:transcription initiation factor TFIID subunit 8
MADDYARSALRIAASQLAEASGFTATRASAVEALTDVAVRYAKALGRGAAAHAELGGRATAHAGDVVSLKGFL